MTEDGCHRSVVGAGIIEVRGDYNPSLIAHEVCYAFVPGAGCQGVGTELPVGVVAVDRELVRVAMKAVLEPDRGKATSSDFCFSYDSQVARDFGESS